MKTLPRVIQVIPKPNQTVWLEFSDGTHGEVALMSILRGAIFEPLRDPEIFNQVKLDGCGSICWPNGADLDPLLLHEIVSHKDNDFTMATKRLEARYAITDTA